MKHYYDTDGHEFQTPPDPFHGRSPMYKWNGQYNDDAFREMGGRIVDDGEPSPKERVCAAFSGLIDELAKKTDAVTPEEFLSAAGNGISSDLIAFARSRGVPEEVITEGRTRIVEIMADALRYGITWNKLIHGVMPQA